MASPRSQRKRLSYSEEEPAVAELSDALEGLDKTEEQARSSLAEHGIALDDEE